MAGAQEQFSAASTVTRADDANTVDPQAKANAETAGVTDAAKINYERALAVYEARSDVETLAARRAREAGDTFEDTHFVRTTADDDPAPSTPTTAEVTFNTDGSVDTNANPADNI